MLPQILFLVVVVSSCASALQVRYGSPVVFSFPCNGNPQYLTQEFVPLTPSGEGQNATWKGVFYMDQWQNDVIVKLDIVLDRNASIEVNPRVVHLIDMDDSEASDPQMKSFRLTTVQPPKSINRIEFKVTGLDGEFPSVRSMNVNGVVLCDNRDLATNVDLIQKLAGDQESEVESGKKKQVECGIRNPVQKDPKEPLIDWPWRVSVLAKDPDSENWSQVVCGGTLISEDVVLTAASCLQGRTAEQLKIQLYSGNVTVKAIQSHSGFKSDTLQDDLAVLLMEPSKEGEAQRYPICVVGPQLSDREPQSNQTIGVLNGKAELQELVLEDGIVCLEKNREEFGKYLSTRNFCARDPSAYKGSILPGEGLYEKIYDDERDRFLWKVIGVASFTEKRPYHLFTNAPKYLSFLRFDTSS